MENGKEVITDGRRWYIKVRKWRRNDQTCKKMAYQRWNIAEERLKMNKDGMWEYGRSIMDEDGISKMEYGNMEDARYFFGYR